MLTPLRDRSRQFRNSVTTALVAAAVLALALSLGQRASARSLGLLFAGFGALALLSQPVLGLLALTALALVVPVTIPTGTMVTLNLASLLAPALVALWLLNMVRLRRIALAPSRTLRPLFFFLLAGLLSLLIGNATWDPFVPRNASFLLVQLAQWAIFAFSASAFLLTANLVRSELWLRRLTFGFLLAAGAMALLRVLPGAWPIFQRLTTGAVDRAPFWLLLVALAGGQLLFNRHLSALWRWFLLLLLAVSVLYAFVLEREGASTWVGVATALALLIWLRLPRLRLPLVAAIVILAAIGVLFPAVYDFAGGDAEWNLSGSSRLVLSKRVIDVTMRNPITGLGPAAYRLYANMNPLVLGPQRQWVGAVVSSHNNYVDLFSHVGLVGLALFGWFVLEVARLGYRLHNRCRAGFTAGYINGVLAASGSALVIMLLADWILPFVYNIGFHGFQASVLLWLFLGGLVALENMPQPVNGNR